MKLEYKPVYDTSEFKPEFLECYAKRQAELVMKIQHIDDEMEMAAIKAKYRPLYIPGLVFIFIPLGAFIGLLIVNTL